MDRTLVFLAVLASFVILCQWFVYSSIRKYLFQRYSPITRKVAYATLGLLALINLAGSRLALDTDVLPVESMIKQSAAVAYFSYLGSILALCLFFLAIGWISVVFDLEGFVRRGLARAKQQKRSFRSEEAKSYHSADMETEAHEKTAAVSEVSPCTSSNSKDVADISPPSANHMARRTFLKWSSAAGVAAVAGFSVDGLAEAFDEPVIERFDFMHPKLNNLSKPLTIAHITDFHLGMFFDSSDLTALVNRLNSLEFDALFITGDLFHSPMTRADLAVAPLRKLKARTIGNFVVLGNHDFYAGVSRSVDCLKQSGLTVLRDQWITYASAKVAIHIGGIDDPMGNWIWGAGFPKFGGFAKSAPKDEGLRILLSHRPNVLPSAAQNHIDFVTSGHVHGGQIIVPVGDDRGWSIARIASHYTHGWYAKGESRMYLSRGVGLTFVPWRINCPPEIALFQLKPSDDGQVRVVRSESQSPVNFA